MMRWIIFLGLVLGCLFVDGFVLWVDPIGGSSVGKHCRPGTFGIRNEAFQKRTVEERCWKAAFPAATISDAHSITSVRILEMASFVCARLYKALLTNPESKGTRSKKANKNTTAIVVDEESVPDNTSSIRESPLRVEFKNMNERESFAKVVNVPNADTFTTMTKDPHPLTEPSIVSPHEPSDWSSTPESGQSTRFDANVVWDLEEVLETVTNADEWEEKLASSCPRLESETDSFAEDPGLHNRLDIIPSTSKEFRPRRHPQSQVDHEPTRAKEQEVFQRRLLKAALHYESKKQTQANDERAPDKKRNELTLDGFSATIPRTQETFQRKLLQERFQREAKLDRTHQKNLKQEQTTELFHRRLLQKRLEYGTRINSKSQTKDQLSTKQKLKPTTQDVFLENPSKAEHDCTTLSSGDVSRMKARQEWVSSLPTVTRERYSQEAQLSHSFSEKEFKPTWWSKNNHFQTIVGTLFRKETMYSLGANDMDVLFQIGGLDRKEKEALHPLDQFQWDDRTRVETPDGDFFVVDWKYSQQGPTADRNNPICLICHGLESCSESEIARELAIGCTSIGIDAACLNFRGCTDGGEECNLTEKAYHLGFTDDLRQQIERIHSQNPKRRIYLSGFSLGAGVVTKLLADLGEDAYKYNVCGAAVNAVPFYTYQCYRTLNEPGFTKFIYGDRLLQSMKRRLKKQYDLVGSSINFPFERTEIDECRTIVDMENLMIASIFGFDDAFDYYDKTQTLNKLHRVSVPQLILQAKDDPFFDGLECPSNDVHRPLKIQYTNDGGHCGYIFHQLEDGEARPLTSFMPNELVRFLAHLEENRPQSIIEE